MKTCILDLLNTTVGVFNSGGSKRIYDPTTSLFIGLLDNNTPPEVSAAYLRYMIFQDNDLAGWMVPQTNFSQVEIISLLNCTELDAKKLCFMLQFVVGWNDNFEALPQFTLFSGDTWVVTMSNGGDNPSGEPPVKPSCLNA